MREPSSAGLSAQRWFVVALLCLVAPILHLLSTGPQVPEGTFFLISRLGDPGLREDPSNLIYSFARSPVYLLIGWSFAYPLAFAVLGVIAHAGFHATVFALVHHVIARERGGDAGARGFALALALTLLVHPLGLATRLAGHGLTLVPHDAYDAFSMRTPFWIVIGLAWLLWGKGRVPAALWAVGLSCWIHPSAGILAFGLATLAFAPRLLGGRRFVDLAHFAGAALLGAAPSLFRLLGAELPTEVTAVDSALWYSSLIKDEADDFSFVFQLLYRTTPFVVIVGVIAATLAASARVLPDAWRDASFRSAAALPLLFVLGVALESAFAVFVPTPFVAPLIALTPGYRLLSFAFFPMLVLGARLAAAGLAWLEERASPEALSPAVPAVLVAAVATAWLGLLGQGVITGRSAAALEYAGWSLGAGRVEGVDAYLAAAARAGRSAYFVPPLFRVDGPVVTYPGERNLLRIRALDREQPRAEPDREATDGLREEDFLELVRRIREEIPSGSGLIIPPYLRHFRDALPEHRIFFQEHHDGNLMMGSPRFLGFFVGRMQELLGLGYEELPSKTSRLNYGEMRRAYLARGTGEVREIGARHPDYAYWVTERSQVLELERVIEAGGLVVYAIPRTPRS